MLLKLILNQILKNASTEDGAIRFLESLNLSVINHNRDRDVTKKQAGSNRTSNIME